MLNDLESYGQLHQHMVELLAPPSLIIDSNNIAIHFSQHVSRYLKLPGGTLTMHVLDIVHPDLKSALQSLLYETRERPEMAGGSSRAVRFNQGKSVLVLRTRRLLIPEFESFILILFDEESEYFQKGDSIELKDELELFKQELQNLKETHAAAQEELNTYNEELQVSNEELRLTLEELHTSNVQLREARDKAEDAAKLQSVFLANMSHELRTPMNGIIGMADLLTYETTDPVLLDLIHTIQRSGDILLNVLNDILDYSKIDAGKLELEHIEFDLWECMEDVTSLFSLNAQQKGNEVCLIIDNKLPQNLVGDPYRLSQIISNLLGNAIKFTENGEITIEVRLEHKYDHAFLISFEVSDTGVGIPEHRQKAIFNAFQQVDATITRNHGGTGLGLTISKNLAFLMKGNITLESQVNKGATFCVTIPFDSAPSAVLQSKKDSEPLKDVHILVLDTHKSVQKLFVSKLTDWGSRVKLAQTADEACDLWKEMEEKNDPFDILFLDQKMANNESQDGLNYPINALSPGKTVLMAPLIELHEKKPHQQDHYAFLLRKPVMDQQLLHCIKSVLSRRN